MGIEPKTVLRSLCGAALIGVLAVGCGPDDGSYGEREYGAAAEPQSNTAVAALVERRIQTEMTAGADSDIDVEVEDGVATLTGHVPDESVKEQAEDVANEVEGIDSVRNEIVVALRGDTTAPGGGLGRGGDDE